MKMILNLEEMESDVGRPSDAQMAGDKIKENSRTEGISKNKMLIFNQLYIFM